jgi:hypothetical protein
MSIDTYVLCDLPLPALPDWQAAIDKQQPAVRLDPKFRPLHDSGVWPVTVNGENSAFEFYRLEPSEANQLGVSANIPGVWQSGVQLSTRADPTEIVGAAVAAVSLAEVCSGALVADGAVYRNAQLRQYLATAIWLAPRFAGIARGLMKPK